MPVPYVSQEEVLSASNNQSFIELPNVCQRERERELQLYLAGVTGSHGSCFVHASSILITGNQCLELVYLIRSVYFHIIHVLPDLISLSTHEYIPNPL